MYTPREASSPQSRAAPRRRFAGHTSKERRGASRRIMSFVNAVLAVLVAWGRYAEPTFSSIDAWIIGGTALLLVGWMRLAESPRAERSSHPLRSLSSVARVGVGAGLGILAVTGGLALLGFLVHPSLASMTTGWPVGLQAVPFLAPVALLGAGAGWLSVFSRWTVAGVSAWLGLAVLSLGFIGYGSLVVREAAGPFALAVGSSLLVLEVFGLSLMLAYQFYAIEHIAGTAADPSPATYTTGTELPRVAIQVASFNEPVEVVEECLESVLALDYPAERRVIQLLDDSTIEATAQELARFCSRRGIQYHHRATRRGFKAGALNDGLAALPANVELLAVVDSDYTVGPRFLRAVVEAFRDPQLAFVQTPQAYRNVTSTRFARWYALADAFFYHVVQPVRARHQSAIFCGTMGVLRRTAVESVGGWSESCVTEDAELSVRLLAGGWRMAYDARLFGRGLAPLSMEGVRSQHRRWAFGGVQMLRMNRGQLRSPRLTARQRRDFWVGGMFWTDGIFFLGMAATLAAVAVGSWFGLALPSPASAALTLAATAPVLLLWDGILKIRIALRPTHPVRYRDVLGILGFWYAVKVNDLRAALRGLAGGSLPFVRTPKSRAARSSRWGALASAVRGTSWETAFAVGLFGVLAVNLWRWVVLRAAVPGPATVVLAGWLAYYAVGLALSPYVYYSSERHPAELPVRVALQAAPA
jgi:cellulose synthase/poly-beta-1,6-N-acetylglucosamine synthase-like glycosyltransferase